MKNTFGNAITVTLFGESHGPAIGAVLDGLAPGIKIDKEYIAAKLEQRKAKGKISTKRQEADEFKILSGVFNGYTTGTPLAIIIENKDVRSADYDTLGRMARPSHADLTAHYKYGGYEDFRGGGHFSGRLTAPLVAVGAILMKALEEKGIYIGTHIKKCYDVCDRDFDCYIDDIKELSKMAFPVLCADQAEAMIKNIEAASSEGDSLGGILETAVIGMPKGVGEPWFDSVESMLSHAMFSIPAVKAVEFGAGFDMANMKGSEANDCFMYVDGEIVTKTNNNGGINGGITNGMPMVFRLAVKPTPSIYKKQETVDFERGENITVNLVGRHDPAIVHRARAVVDAMTAITLADMLTVRFGTNYLSE